MHAKRPLLRLLAPLTALGLVAAACGGGEEGGGGTTTTQQETPVKGGTLVIGAEQQPDCADMVHSCMGAAWGVWTMGEHTLPRAFQYNFTRTRYDITSLLTGEPRFEPGPPMKVTYTINPKAVWSDGTPITSSDFRYTWEQIATGQEINDRTGYDRIQAVDDSKPDTAVVTFKEPYANWQDLFGGFYGILPKHLLQGKDRNAEMKDGYKFSGGPWMIESWIKDQEVKLVPNPRYWDQKPNLDAVVFRFIGQETAAQIQAFKSGQVAMIYPQAQPELAEVKTLPDTKFDVVLGLAYEGLFFNTQKPPLNSPKVRQALAFATDRDAIVTQLFGSSLPGIKPIQAMMSSANKQWYSEPFAKYKKDLKMVNQLMSEDGWTRGGDGIWAKGGQRATLQLGTTAGNRRRELTEQIVQSQWKEAGFEVTISNNKPPTFFGQLTKGDFQVGLYGEIPSSPDPGLCTSFCSQNIPSPANEMGGRNVTRLASKALDDAWLKVDSELDEVKRKELVDAGQRALADELPGLPVDAFPDFVIYNSAKLAGPINHNFAYGPFVNMHEWFCRGGKC